MPETEVDKSTAPPNSIDQVIDGKTVPEETFKTRIKRFTDQVSSISSTAPLLLGHLILLGTWSARRAKRILTQLKGLKEDELDNAESLAKFTKLRLRDKQAHESARVFNSLPSSFLVSLVTEYDILVAGVYRLLLKCVPDIIVKSKKVPDYSELLSMIEHRRDTSPRS